MIRWVSSSLPTFKSLTFGPGLNILLADVTDTSTEKQTRNSAGKTSLVEVIHFLLGSDAKKDSLFKHESIIRHSFSIGIDVGGHEIQVTRSGNRDKCVFLSDDHADTIGVILNRDDDGSGYISLDVWKNLLGARCFDLPDDRDSTPFASRYAPTFRQLIGYFARRRKSGGYDTIEKQNQEQKSGDWQVALSYLLGLDWEVAREFQEMREREKSASVLKKAIKEGELGKIFGTAAEIRPELARTEERIGKLKAQIEHFQVHESYREQAARAAHLKDQISEITYSLADAEETVAYLSRSVEEEKPPAYADVERLYKAVGIELPGVVLRRFEDVRDFQASVTANRRNYLEEQINELKARRTRLNGLLTERGLERAKILKALDGKGAFEDLIRLQEDLGVLSSRAETLKSKLQYAAAFENNVAQLKRETADLQIKLQDEHKRDEDRIKKATVMVDRVIGELYDDRTGNLIIEAAKNGPQVKIDIEGDGNKGGIDMMKIFCFDMMLFQMSADRFKHGPGFMVHDSHLFDGVDSRQVLKALTFGAKVAKELKGQYIVTLNSDEFLKDQISDGTTLESAVLSIRLTDDESGGLFGFRFDLKT